MRVGYLATLFDKIQHAYGWTDDVILDLPLKRAIQIREAIDQREEFRRWEDHKVTEWLAISLSSIIANTPQEPKHREELNKVVSKLSLTGNKKADTTTGNGMKPRRSYKTKDGKVITAAELKDYSYDEIDHSDEEQAAVERALAKNKGNDLAQMMSSFGPKLS